MGDLPDFVSRRVEDPDLRPHVALRVESERNNVAVCGTHVAQVLEFNPGLVVVGDDEDLRVNRLDGVAESIGHLALLVEDALGRLITAIDALARNAIVLGRVPVHESFEDVVVREVAVLVVWRIKVRQIHVVDSGSDLRGVPADRHAAARDQFRAAEFEVIVRSCGPLLEVGHLNAGRRIDSIGREDE